MAEERNPIRFSRFDQVRLLTTKNVQYLSAPPSSRTSPHGIWSVAAAVQTDLLLVQRDVTIRIPVADVQKVVEYDINHIDNLLGSVLKRGQENRQNNQKARD